MNDVPDPDPSGSLLVASNRGPVTFEAGDGEEMVAKRGAGGLVTALTEVVKQARGLWMAAAMSPGDVQMVRSHAQGRLSAEVEGGELRLRYLDIHPDVYDRYYNDLCNAILWFMNHNMWNLPYSPNFDAGTALAWDAYRSVNRLFAEGLAEELASNKTASVMLQDYHLTLAAQYLKQLLPEAFSYHFTHTPWTQPATMSVLPRRVAQEVLAGMLANDLLGFHSPRWANNFMWCCQELLGAEVDRTRQAVQHDGRTTSVRAYPIAIEPEAVRAAAHSDESPGYLQWLEDLLDGRQLVLRIDRFELSKNVLRGFSGFAQMLKNHPELRGKVVHLALLYPSRQALKQYQDYEAEAHRLAEQINAELGTGDWQPIVLISEPNYIRAITCCRRYDVLLVNPISDGMNLVAKEGPAVNENDGVVVLSRNAGAWDQLQDGVLSVNPYDTAELAEALHRGLTMPAGERRALTEHCLHIVQDGSPDKWMKSQLHDMDLLREG